MDHAVIEKSQKKVPWLIDYEPHLPEPLKLARSTRQLKHIATLRQTCYSKRYPAIKDFSTDPYDRKSVVIFTENSKGIKLSTARIVFDSEFGLPEDNVFGVVADGYRQRQLSIAELGRFVILNPDISLLRAYYRAFFEIALLSDTDIMLIVMRLKDRSFHERLLGAEPLGITAKHGFGSNHTFIAMRWVIARTPRRFFKWIQSDSRVNRLLPGAGL